MSAAILERDRLLAHGPDARGHLLDQMNLLDIRESTQGADPTPALSATVDFNAVIIYLHT
jgi:hypothetical protein